MSFVGIHHVQLAMPRGGEIEAERFYAAALGLTRVPKPERLASRGGCWFRGGSVEVHLGIEDPFRPATKAHPALLVRGLDALASRLTAAGSHVTWDDAIPGVRRFHVPDPFGNRIEVVDAQGAWPK